MKFLESIKERLKKIDDRTWNGLTGAIMFGFMCISVGFIAGSFVGHTNERTPVYFQYMLGSTYGTHTLGASGETPKVSKDVLDKMVKMAKKHEWSVVGEPFVVEGKNGKVYMYQKIMKLYWSKDEG